MKPPPLPLNPTQFLADLTEQFPLLAAEVFDEDYQGLFYVQVGCLATYANNCYRRADWPELKRVIDYFQQRVAQVEAEVENALYVAFLEHLDFEGDTLPATRARSLLHPPYQAIWQQLRAQ
jgi:hypothetical protein